MATRDSDPGSDPPEDSTPTPPSRRDPVVEAMQDVRRRLAQVEHARRQAIHDARTAEGDRPSAPHCPPAARVPALDAPAEPADGFGPARDKLPTLDELADSGPVGKTARWKLALAGVAALASLSEIVRQVAALLGH